MVNYTYNNYKVICMAIEIERKYIIRMPDIDKMRAFPEYSVSDILQIYIASESSVTHRVRARKSALGTVYTETKKVRIDKMSAHEQEREISQERFLLLSQSIKEGTVPINKVRHTFVFEGQLFEVDIYPEWKNTCILETELPSRESAVRFPDFIEILEEVTGNRAYSNAAMAKSFPAESVI